MTEVQQVTETQQASPDVVQQVAEAVTASTETPPETKVETKPEQQLLFDEPKEGEKPAEVKEEKPAEEIKYELSLPDGQELPEEAKAQFSDFAKSQGYTQEQAQASLNKYYEYEQSKIAEVQKVFKGWRTETESDPELGGQNLNATVNRAKKALLAFGDDELKQDLETFGLGNKKSMLRFLNKVSGLISEDSVSGTKAGTATEKLSPEKVLYPEMK